MFPCSIQALSESLPLPNFEVLLLCLNNTQKNNGSQLISSTYMFFETIIDGIISHQPSSQLKTEAIAPRENFGFKIDTFNLYNSLQEMKKVPITKIYPQMIKPIKSLSADFSGIKKGLALEEWHE